MRYFSHESSYFCNDAGSIQWVEVSKFYTKYEYALIKMILAMFSKYFCLVDAYWSVFTLNETLCINRLRRDIK